MLATYGALVDGLRPLGLAYLSVLHEEPGGDLVQELRRRFDGPLIANSGFGLADHPRRGGAADRATRTPRRSPSAGWSSPTPTWSSAGPGEHPENVPNPATFYAAGAEGYTDYPTLTVRADGERS